MLSGYFSNRNVKIITASLLSLLVAGVLLATTMATGLIAAADAAYNPAPGTEFTAIADAANSYLNGLGSFLPAGDQTPSTIEASEVFALLDTDNNGTLGSAGDDYRKGPTIIDVRAASDYSKGHIAGAINLPFASIAQQVNLDKVDAEIAKHDNNNIVVYCYTGHTEQVASMALGELGYKAKGMKWGMLSWANGAAQSYPNSNAVSSTPVAPTANNPYPTIAAGTTVQQAANNGASTTAGGGIAPAANEDPAKRTYVDLRSAAEYNSAHVPGAINITWQDLFKKDQASGAYPNLEQLSRSKQIMVYGNTQHESNMVAVALNMLGYKSTASTPELAVGMRFGFAIWNSGYGEKFDLARDGHGYPLVTGTAPGGYLPVPLTVTKTVPASGATDAPASVTVKAEFSKAVDSATISSTNFYLKDAAGNKVQAGVMYDPAANSATLDPLIDLTMGKTYTATVTKGIKDTGGGSMDADYSWSFTVVACDGTALPAGQCLPVPLPVPLPL